MSLSEAKIRNAKPKDKPYKLFDGGGLFLLVTRLADSPDDRKAKASKLWKVKYRYQGKEKEFAAGAYPQTNRTSEDALVDRLAEKIASKLQANNC